MDVDEEFRRMSFAEKCGVVGAIFTFNLIFGPLLGTRELEFGHLLWGISWLGPPLLLWSFVEGAWQARTETPAEQPQSPDVPNPADLQAQKAQAAALGTALVAMDEQQLKSLAGRLDVDWDDLAGDTKMAKIFGLYTSCKQQGNLKKLLDAAKVDVIESNRE